MDQKLDSFTRAYIECMLWSSNDESTESGGEPLDKNYDISNLTESALEKCIKDCAEFQKKNKQLLELAELEDSRAGFCFCLSRNGQGSGFFDEFSQTICENYNKEQEKALISRDFSLRDNLDKTCNCKYHACQRLQEKSRETGEINPYVTDSGQIDLA